LKIPGIHDIYHLIREPIFFVLTEKNYFNKKYAMKNRNPLLSYIPVLLAMVFWSFSFIWYKQVFLYYQPITVIVLRLIIAVPLLFIISIVSRRLQGIQKRHLRWFFILGFFEPFLYFIGECYGVRLVSPTLASIIISLIPLLSPIPARFLFREKFTLTNYIGLFISMAGVILVIMDDNHTASTSMAGVFLMLLAVFGAVGHSVYVRKLVDHYNTFTIVTYQSTFGLIYFIPLFFFTEYKQFVLLHHHIDSLMPVVKLAVFASTLAFLFFVKTIKNFGMARTNVFVNLIPVFTAILSFLILHEHFGLLKLTGIGVVIAGLVFSQYSRSSVQSHK
jgi:drug/metabolite transporter (DMT)-like permease